MSACQIMREEANLAYAQLEAALKDISEPLAWARIKLAPEAYLNSNGTIIGIVQHIAGCKFIYGSAAYRSLEVRFRDIHARLGQIGTSWEDSLAYLAEGHKYWISTWAELADEELSAERMNFRNKPVPTWKLIATVTQHDAYHAGQIELLASALEPATSPPDMEWEQEIKHIIDLPSW